MRGFDREWKEYRKLRRRFFLIWAAYLPACLITDLLATLVFGRGSPWAAGTAMLAAVSWVLLGLWLSRPLRDWRCPRCQRPFHTWKGPLTPRCANCGLPRYST